MVRDPSAQCDAPRPVPRRAALSACQAGRVTEQPPAAPDPGAGAGAPPPPYGQTPSGAGQPGQPGQPPYPPPVYGQAYGYSYGPPGYTQVYVAAPTPRTSTTAIIAMVLAGLSFLYCPVVFAIVALVMAQQAEREIAESNGWVTGDGLVTGARIAAWLNIGLAVLVVVVVFVLAAVSTPHRA